MSDASAKTKQTSKYRRYHSDPEYRQKYIEQQVARQKARYDSDPEFREDRKRRSRERYRRAKMK